jgi:anti-sigma factor ChrR (cupin superfamily)
VVKHTRLTEPLRERASLYALGALDADTSRDFEAHLRDSCRVCRREAAAFAEVTANLALAAPAAMPSPELRARVLAGARAPRTAVVNGGASQFSFTLAGEGVWNEIAPGVLRKELRNSTGASSFLVRLQPGARVAAHTHATLEHCFVLEGGLHIAGRDLVGGDYHCASPGSTHESIRSDHGCVLLIVESPVTS